MQVKEIMTKHVVTLPAEATLTEAAKTMLVKDIGSIPVCKGKKIIGIVTDRDIAVRGVARGLDPTKAVVKDVMTRNVLSCTAGEEIQSACDLMEINQIRRLVISEDGEDCVGIVSLGDIALQIGHSDSGRVLKEVSQHP